MSGLIVALDTADVAEARAWAASVAPHAGLVKLGLQFFCAHGPAGVREVTPGPMFLDLKLCDIPNTVAGAVRSVLALRPRMLTLHAMGGSAMIAAARTAAEQAAEQRPMLLAVTVLTSLDAAALRDIGVADAPDTHVLRLARLALAAGADGLVCAPTEVAMLRRSLGTDPLLVVPGVRPEGSVADDQARTLTPREAARAGADWLVVGRPITAAADPAAAAARIVAEIG